ncbi:MAG: T9SS type A sorting domain-containing protein, partial [Ignavibacteria bacterium]
SQKIPERHYLYQNYPNPFNPNSKIKFQISKLGDVKLKVFDVLGREVAVLVNDRLKPGSYEIDWNASGYPSGVYLYKLSAGEYTETKKMILIK